MTPLKKTTQSRRRFSGGHLRRGKGVAMKDVTEDKVKQQLMEDIKRQGVSPGVHKSAVSVLRTLSSKLLKSKRRKNLLFVVLHAAYIDAGEFRSLDDLAKDLDIRGKYCNISPRANLIQLKDGQQYAKPLIDRKSVV